MAKRGLRFGGQTREGAGRARAFIAFTSVTTTTAERPLPLPPTVATRMHPTS